jgi:hypothetical protein
MFIAALFTIVGLGNSQDAPLLMNGLRKCGIYIQWSFILQQRNEMFLRVGKWMELENSILREVRQVQKAKATCFLSYMEYITNIKNRSR